MPADRAWSGNFYEVMWAALPCMLVLIAAIVAYVPELSLVFPRFLYGVCDRGA